MPREDREKLSLKISQTPQKKREREGRRGRRRWEKKEERKKRRESEGKARNTGLYPSYYTWRFTCSILCLSFIRHDSFSKSSSMVIIISWIMSRNNIRPKPIPCPHNNICPEVCPAKPIEKLVAFENVCLLPEINRRRKERPYNCWIMQWYKNE